MAKTTLLELTQGILSVADGDEVNSISDTIESDQCARVIRDEYNIIADEFDLKMSETLTQLTATSSSTPTRMDRPEGFHSIETIWYDTRLLVGDDPRFQRIIFQDPETFLQAAMSLNASDTSVSTLTLSDSGHTLNFRNERTPTYWTILEGYDEIYFNSFDGDLETNLQASKTLVKGVQRPTLALTDAAVPDIPENLMVLLRNRAQAFYFDVYKDGVTREIAKRQSHSEVRSQRKKYVTKKLQQERSGPNYGRKA